MLSFRFASVLRVFVAWFDYAWILFLAAIGSLWWLAVRLAFDPDPANKEKLVTWARSYFDALHPLSAGGAYINFMMEEGDERIRATYGKNYGRLARIKKRYDPKNLFRVNQNIKPA